MKSVLSFGCIGGIAAAAALTCSLATPASADAFANATAEAVLMIPDTTDLSIVGLTFDGTTDPTLFDEFELGVATAIADGFSAFVGDGLEQLAEASAETGFFEPLSLGFAFFGTDGFLGIANLTGDDIEVEVALAWLVFAEATADNVGDAAFAEAIVDLSGSLSFTAFAGADTLLGPASEFGSGVNTFSLMIPENGSAELLLLVDAVASALTIPVANSLPLVGTGLLGLGFVGLRRKA